MKIKDKKTLHGKSLQELNNLLREEQDILSNLKLDKTQNKLKNTSQLSLKRQQIAIMLTMIREKELFEAKSKKIKLQKEGLAK